MKLLIIFTMVLLLSACTSEYVDHQAKFSKKGLLVLNDNEDYLLDGVLIFKRKTEILSIEVEDGLINGDLLLTRADEIIYKAEVVAKKDNTRFRLASSLERRSLSKFDIQDMLRIIKEIAVFEGEFYDARHEDAKTIGRYENGKKTGVWEVWCDNKQRKKADEYRINKDGESINVGKKQEYTCDGQLLLEANYQKNGSLDGDYIRFRMSLRNNKKNALIPVEKLSYKNGSLDGIQEKYDYNGLLQEQSHYINDLLEGERKKYMKGKVVSKTSYKDNMKFGEETHYFTDSNLLGKLAIKSQWHNVGGKKHGSYAEYNKQGVITNKGTYEKNEKVGEWLGVNLYNDELVYTYHYQDNLSEYFLVDKVKGFTQACRIQEMNNYSYQGDRKKRYSNNDLDNCYHYINNQVVDWRKKINYEHYRFTQKSGYSASWAYPITLVPYDVYSLLKQLGANTKVHNSKGENRLLLCLYAQNSRSSLYENGPFCPETHIDEYIMDVNLEDVTGIGNILHWIARQRLLRYELNDSSQQLLLTTAQKILKVMPQLIYKKNFKGNTPLAVALSNSDFVFAKSFLNAYSDIAQNGSQLLQALFWDVNQNEMKRKALSNDAVDVLSYLIAHGVDVEKPIKEGKTLRDWIEDSNTLFHLKSLALARKRAQSIVVKDKKTTSVTPVNSVEIPPAIADIEDIELEKQTNNTGLSAQESVTQKVETSNNKTLSEKDTQVDETMHKLQLKLQQQVKFLTKQAERHILENRLKTPENNSALSVIEQISVIDADNPIIVILYEKMSQKYIQLAKRQAEKGNEKSALGLLNSAKEYASNPAKIEQQRKLIKQQVTREATVSRRSKKEPFYCDPVIKGKGVNFLGRTVTATQNFSLPLKETIYGAKKYFSQNYSSVRLRAKNRISFTQSASNGNIRGVFHYMKNGVISLQFKFPVGLAINKNKVGVELCKVLDVIYQ